MPVTLAPPSAPPRAAATASETRDRFLAFAFAAADLLVETSPEGTIGFATGAFRARFGCDAASVVGRHVSSLISPLHQAPFALALASVGLRGRIAPMVLRLSDASATPSCVSAMLMPGSAARLCLTFGPVPLSAPDDAGMETALADGQKAFTRAAQQRLHDPVPPSSMGLFELKGWKAAKDKLSVDDQQALRRNIGSVLMGAGSGALASEVADGRFGVLAWGRWTCRRSADSWNLWSVAVRRASIPLWKARRSVSIPRDCRRRKRRGRCVTPCRASRKAG